MGANIVDDKSKDLLSAYNITKGHSFRFELTENYESYIKQDNGLTANDVSIVMKINGYCDAEINDEITFNNTKHTVIRIRSAYDNQNEAQKRIDFSNFTGTTWLLFE